MAFEKVGGGFESACPSSASLLLVSLLTTDLFSELMCTVTSAKDQSSKKNTDEERIKVSRKAGISETIKLRILRSN